MLNFNSAIILETESSLALTSGTASVIIQGLLSFLLYIIVIFITIKLIAYIINLISYWATYFYLKNKSYSEGRNFYEVWQRFKEARREDKKREKANKEKAKALTLKSKNKKQK